MDFIGLLILIVLCLSMRFRCKFKTHQEDPVASNDMCARVFGANAEQKWKEFKLLFSLDDPRIDPPPKKVSPNHKVQIILDHTDNVFHEAWAPGNF